MGTIARWTISSSIDRIGREEENKDPFDDVRVVILRTVKCPFRDVQLSRVTGRSRSHQKMRSDRNAHASKYLFSFEMRKAITINYPFRLKVFGRQAKKKTKLDGAFARISSMNVRWLKETMEIVGPVVRPQMGTSFACCEDIRVSVREGCRSG